MNRLAAIARKHSCPEVAKHIIATQYGFNAMEVQEAFVKITEQAKASLEQPRLYMEGVNLLSSQNLDYFSNTHQVLYPIPACNGQADLNLVWCNRSLLCAHKYLIMAQE